MLHSVVILQYEELKEERSKQQKLQTTDFKTVYEELQKSQGRAQSLEDQLALKSKECEELQAALGLQEHKSH